MLGTDGMGNAFINSLIVTIPSTVIPITIAAFAAYAFAWIRFRGRGMLFTIVVGLLVVPLQMSLIPILSCTAAVRPVRHVPGHLAGAHRRSACRWPSSCSTTSSRSCRATCSRSAAIDGAIALPDVHPDRAAAVRAGPGAFAIFQFLWVWNDLLVALVFLGASADVRVMPTALYNMIGSRGEQWHLLTAGAFLTMILPLLVFLLAAARLRARDPGGLRQVLTSRGVAIRRR